MPIITAPEGKICDHIDHKIRKDSPEEYVRQTIERLLLDELKYKPEQIKVEFPLKIGTRTPRADLVIWDAKEQTQTQDTAKIIIECKRESISSENGENGLEQLKSYMTACINCEWGMWTNSRQKIVLRKIKNAAGTFEFDEYNDIPAADGNISSIDRPERKNLRNASDDNLLFVFRTCHNHIYANEGVHKSQAFFEFLKIIFCKIQDERNIISKFVDFYATSQERKTEKGQQAAAERITKIFDNVKATYSFIFDPNDKINLTNRTLAHIVGILQGYSLLNTNIDIKGKAYEEIVGSNLRGDRGEFFTPRNIMKMTVEMINPGKNEKVLDSSCGTGGFLVMALNHVMNELQRETEESLERPKSEWNDYEKFIFRDKIKETAAKNFFGFDLNPDLAKATRMNMVMNNDGSGNILQVNSLLPPRMWPDSFKSHLARSLGIKAADIKNFKTINLFDVVVTNPPFGSKIPIIDRYILDQYELAHIWEHDKDSGDWTMTEKLQASVPPEILFVERCTQFLKEGGRMGIILPDSILSSPSLGYIRKWILINHKVIASLDLTSDTFQPNNGTQTSVLILEKKTEREKMQEAMNHHIANYFVFMSIIRKVGHDRRGNILYKRDENGDEIYIDGQRIVDDETPEVWRAFREWAEKKTTYNEKEKYLIPIAEILSDKDLRLDVESYNKKARNTAHNIQGGKFGAVKFSELANSYTLGRSVRVVSSKSPYPFYQPSSVINIKPQIDGYLWAKKYSDIEELIIHKGQVLLTCSGTIGRAVYVSDTLDGKILSSDMIRIDAHESDDAGYIYAYLKSSAGQEILKSLAYGAVIQHITPAHLKYIPIPNAPRELRAKIHDLVVKSYELRDKSNILLDEAEKILFRELNLPPLEEMSQKNKVRYSKISSDEAWRSDRLDANFHKPVYAGIIAHMRENAEEIITVGNERVSEKIFLPGRFKRFYVDEKHGVPFFGGRSIDELDPTDKKYLSFSKHEARIRNELTIRTNMILITRSGTIGNTALVPEHWDGWTVSDDLIRVIAQKNFDGYLYVYLNSEYGRALLKRFSYGAVIQHVDDEHVASVPFPLLKNHEAQAKINALALEANALRFSAYNLEREALAIMDREIINPS